MLEPEANARRILRVAYIVCAFGLASAGIGAAMLIESRQTAQAAARLQADEAACREWERDMRAVAHRNAGVYALAYRHLQVEARRDPEWWSVHFEANGSYQLYEFDAESQIVPNGGEVLRPFGC